MKKTYRILLIAFLYIAFITIFSGCGGSSTSGDNTSSNNENIVINDDSTSSNNKNIIISGYVVDDPIVGATIEVYDENGTQIAKEVNATDKKGYFSLKIKDVSKYMLVATDGKIDGKPFKGTLYSICFDKNCNITPITSILALEFKKTLKNVTQQDIQSFAQEVLGINDYNSVNLNEIKKISNYINSNDLDIDSVIADITNDLSNGYADNKITVQLFPNVKKRQITQKQFEIDLSKIENYENKNLKIFNLRTGEKVDINHPINYRDYRLNIALVQDYNYTFYDGTELNKSTIIYLPFKPYSDNKLDINSTLYYYLFFDSNLANLPDVAKKSLIQVLNTKYKELMNRLRETYKNYINYGNIYKTQLSSQISFLQSQLIKNELANYNILQNKQVSKVLARMINSTYKSNLENKNYFNLGGLKVTHDVDENKTYVRNLLPVYLGFADKSQFEIMVNDGYYDFTSKNAIIDSLDHKIIEKNSGGGVGLLVSSLISNEKFGGKKTDLSINNGENTYVFYKSNRLTSITSILNYLDIASKLLEFTLDLENIKNIIQNSKNISSRVYKKAKEALDFISIGLSVIDSFFTLKDIITDEKILKAFNIPYNKEDVKKIKNMFEEYKNVISSLQKTTDEIKKTLDAFNIVLPEPKSFYNTSLDEINITKSFESFFNKITNGGYSNIKLFSELGKIPTYDGKPHLDLMLAATLMFFREDDNYKNYFNKLVSIYNARNTRYFNTDKLSIAMYIIFNAMKAKKISNNRLDSYAYNLHKKGYLVVNSHPENRYSVMKATFNTMKYFENLHRFSKHNILDYAENFKTSLDFILSTVKETTKTVKSIAKFSSDAIKMFSEKSFYEAIWYLFIKPSIVKGIEGGEEIIKDKIINLLTANPYGKIITVANEVGGKAVSFLMFPNKMTFKATRDSNNNIYFKSTLDGITPIGFEKGIVLPSEISKQYAILKKPTNDSFYGLLVADKNNPSWYRPYFQTIFKESASNVRGVLDDLKEKTFVEIEWEYKTCPSDSIDGKFSLDETLCSNFNDNYLSYTITGDDVDGGKEGDRILGYHDKFILPYPNKNGSIYNNGSYFDFFDYLAVKFSAGGIPGLFDPGLEDANFNIKNETRGIYLDKISAKYYGFDESKSNSADNNNISFSSPKAINPIFKIASAKDFDYSVEVNNTSLKITNLSTQDNPVDLTFLIIKSSDFLSETPPKKVYSFSIPYSFDELQMTKVIPILDISMLGDEITIIAVDSILKDYAKYIGMDNIMDVIYLLYDSHRFKKVSDFLKAYTYSEIYNQSAYPFMKAKSLQISINNPPIIDYWDLEVTDKTTVLSISVTDSDNDPLKCFVNWGDGSNNEFNCNEDISHTYANAGEYNISITVNDNKGLTNIVHITQITIPNENIIDEENTTTINQTNFKFEKIKAFIKVGDNKYDVNYLGYILPYLRIYNFTDHSVTYGKFLFAMKGSILKVYRVIYNNNYLILKKIQTINMKDYGVNNPFINNGKMYIRGDYLVVENNKDWKSPKLCLFKISDDIDGIKLTYFKSVDGFLFYNNKIFKRLVNSFGDLTNIIEIYDENGNFIKKLKGIYNVYFLDSIMYAKHFDKNGNKIYKGYDIDNNFSEVNDLIVNILNKYVKNKNIVLLKIYKNYIIYTTGSLIHILRFDNNLIENKVVQIDQKFFHSGPVVYDIKFDEINKLIFVYGYFVQSLAIDINNLNNIKKYLLGCGYARHIAIESNPVEGRGIYKTLYCVENIGYDINTFVIYTDMTYSSGVGGVDF